DAVEPGDALPAEQDVARRLHQALALDDALAVLVELALAEERLEHRGLRLLELEEQRVALVATEHEYEPGARPDAAHPVDLARGVDVPEPLEQLPAVARQCAAVGAEDHPRRLLDLVALGRGREILDRDDQRRVGDDPRLAVDDRDEL